MIVPARSWQSAGQSLVKQRVTGINQALDHDGDPFTVRSNTSIMSISDGSKLLRAELNSETADATFRFGFIHDIAL